MKNKKTIIIAIIAAVLGLLALCCIGAALLYHFAKSRSEPTAQQQEDQDNGLQVPEGNDEEPAENTEKRKIAFVRLKNPQTDDDNELWMADWNGENAEILGIDNVREVYNGPNTKWIIYAKGGVYNKLFAYNRLDGSTKEIVEADPENATSQIAEANAVSLSPDGMIIAYYVHYFSTTCDDICPDADPYLVAKTGFYAYHLETDEKVYLGKFLLVANWDKNSQNIYTVDGEKYHEYDLSEGSYRIDVTTGEATLMNETPLFYESNNYVEELNLRLRHYADAAEKSHLSAYKAEETKEIDQAAFAAFQPFLWISPERIKGLYEKQDHYVNGVSYDSYILLNFETLQKKTVLTPDGNEIFSMPFWVNNEHFITTAITGEYPNEARKLYLVNSTTGEREQITDFNDVTFY